MKDITYYDIEVNGVHDGDTASLQINLFCNKNFYIGPCRLLRIDAPELKLKDGSPNPAGIAAQEELARILKRDLYVICKTDDKYGRPLVTVFAKKIVNRVTTWFNVNEWLLEHGFAKRISLTKQINQPKNLHLPVGELVQKK